jgi:hypothetical protein
MHIYEIAEKSPQQDTGGNMTMSACIISKRFEGKSPQTT